MNKIRLLSRQIKSTVGRPGGFLLAVAGILLAVSAPAQDSPEAAIPTAIWDFGYVPQKSEVEHLFYLHNTGSAPLSVTKIKSGCSCTSISELDASIAPGDSAAISVVFKSGRYISKVQKTTKIFTDNPDAPVYHLIIKAVVVKHGAAAGYLDVVPQRLKWKIQDDVIAAGIDTILVTTDSDDTLSVAVLHFPEEVVQSIGHPDRINQGEETYLVVRPSDRPLTTDINALSVTLAFMGRDTTIVTIPVEIDD